MEFLKLFNLSNNRIDVEKSYDSFDSSANNHTINLWSKKDIISKCPKCNSIDLYFNGTRKKKINYAASKEMNITLIFHRQSYKCNSCDYYFQEDNPFVFRSRKISLNTKMKVLELLKMPNLNYDYIAKEVGISKTSVINIFDQYVSLHRVKLPQVLSIDEIYAKKLTVSKYCCILYSPQLKLIIDVLPSRHKLKLIDYFAHIPFEEKLKVEYVSIDMWESYKEVANLCLPKAKVCVDSFHVIKHLNDCFQQIRIRIMKKYEYLKHQNDNYYWLLKKYNRFLLTDISNLPDTIQVSHSKSYMTKYQVIDYMLSIDYILKKAYELKEEYRHFNETSTVEEAPQLLAELIHKFKISGISEYEEFWKLLEHWHDEIINSFNRINGYRISNGKIERVNNTIKLIIRTSYGLSNFERMRNRVMYVNNESAPIRAVPKTTTNKKVGKKRGKYKKNN